MFYDYLVIAVYFVMILSVGAIFARMAEKSTSDYFRGGGRMLWWMVGATAFMAQFSAVTFTGAAGKAFADGFAISLVYIANTFAYFVGWAFFAHRFRQMRVDTPTEAVRRRFGHGNELFFSWALIIFSFLNAGVWLNALGVFSSAVFGADISVTIVVIGLTVVFVSVLSGAWGVVASDFVQTLVVAVISVACAIVALVKVGGPVEMVSNFPGGFLVGPNMNHTMILVGTFLFFIPKQIITIMNLHDSFRFLTAKDSENARKASLLAMTLMGVGTIIWFIPPWAAATLYPDAAAGYSELGSKAADAVYLEFTRLAMPAGTVGLLMAALFAASMSSMDSALNKNAGIFIRSIYQPFLARRNRKKDDKKLLRISQLISFLSGLLVIAAALFFASLKELSLFELMMSVSTMVQVPLLVPLLFGIFVKKTPAWASWATVAVGFFVSWLVMNVFTADVFASMVGIESLTDRETVDMNIILTIGGHLFITAGFFCATTLFYNEATDINKVETERFFEDLKTPYIADDQQDEADSQQRHKLGLMVMTMGAAIMLMSLIPNPLWGRFMFLICASIILAIGFMLKKSATQVAVNS
ncbi:Sodium/glucose cotransporter [Zhongshania aliphaticivorans]|uniref:Sodium/glucose cotransporter n=1 Tax=Zhongshania aliphaticivorans TaxID=1470434 RepID=A0A5S9N7B9_9GAMM|nr:transporter [Zhongshania aliphaticivorans]CAA0082843.1 Sodium/glucose cotransporter [Zhongshania aliphaticivorans]CAA0083942.1 Sodium/glucose cotransporter [Zhongshania aliphaticivorans]